MPMVKEGRALSVHVKSFQDAQTQLNILIRAGIVKCTGGHCHNPATHVYWQDQAEWYEHCEEHRDYGPQWTGSTRWSSSVLSVAVLPQAAQAWLAGLPEAERQRYQLDAYDARDLYSLLPEWRTRKPETHRFADDETRPDWYTEIEIQALTTGEFAYGIHIQQGNHGRSFGLVGTFDSALEALTYAQSQDEDFPERFRIAADEDDPGKTKPFKPQD
jgi:hypothetical protein